MTIARKVLLLLALALFLSLPIGMALAQDMDVMNPATFGLDASKPYDGTHLNFLICCSTAPQFASAAVKGADEFTAMTGISVSWGDLPFGSFQEQLYLEATNPNTEFDIVAFVDAWGTNIYDFLHPLNDFVEDAGFDWNDYSPAYQGAATGLSDTIYGMPFRGHPLLLITARTCWKRSAWAHRRPGRISPPSAKRSKPPVWISLPSLCTTA